MNLKIGDKVRFLNEKGEGVVSKMLNKTTAAITIESGFEIPYVISELIVIHDEIKGQQIPKTTEEPASHFEIQSSRNQKKAEQEGIYIAFSPEKINDIPHSDFNVWLINHTSYKIVFTYSIVKNGSFITIETGGLSAFESELIETIDQKLLQDFSNFKIDVLFFNEEEHDHQLPLSEIIKLKPIKLYKENTFAQNNFITDNALVMTVCKLNELEEEPPVPKADLSKILFQKQMHSDKQKKSKPHANNNPANEMEIDLHIEELLDNYSGMSNAEIIQIQLKHFQNALDGAINDHYRKLIVIHGVGNGRLKQEVRSILSGYNNLRVFDGSYSKYGFGATEIVIS